MKFTLFSLYFLCTFFSMAVYGTDAFEDLRLNAHTPQRAFEAFDQQAARASGTQILPSGLRSGYGAPQTEQSSVADLARSHRERYAETQESLDAYESAVLKGLFGDDFDLSTLSPYLVKSCNFKESEGNAAQAQKYQNLGHALLFSSLINTSALEKLALRLQLSGKCDWKKLDTSNKPTTITGPVFYSVALDRDSETQQITNRRVRFYFHNKGWGMPENIQTGNPNLVTAQVNIDLNYSPETGRGTPDYTTRMRGRYVKNIGEDQRKQLAGKAYWLSAQLYGISAKESRPKADESDEQLKSIVGAHFVDMATSAATMYRYTAHLEDREAIKRLHLLLSDGLLRDARQNLIHVENYQRHVQAAHFRILAFPRDLSLTEDQFVKDFRFVVGRTPQFILDRVEKNALMRTIGKELREIMSVSKRTSDESTTVGDLEREKAAALRKRLEEVKEMENPPALKTWGELMKARAQETLVEDYPGKLTIALGINPQKLGLYLERHMTYYKGQALATTIQRAEASNAKLRLTLRGKL